MSALDRLTQEAEAGLAKMTKPVPRPKHDFTAIGEQIAATLLKAAEDQVVEAQNLLDSVKVLAEGIGAQLEDHARMLNDMNERMRAFGKDVVEAHHKYLGNGKHEKPLAMTDKELMFTIEQIKHADDEQAGYCLHCGNMQYNCEPDARNRKCEACGERRVFGAQELVIMGRVK